MLFGKQLVCQHALLSGILCACILHVQDTAREGMCLLLCVLLSTVVQDAAREGIIREVINSPLLPRLLQDGYGNYVVQVGNFCEWFSADARGPDTAHVAYTGTCVFLVHRVFPDAAYVVETDAGSV